ncbi:MAG: 3-phosphoshikimate 1-carboxyvinyltransferase [Aigarchaeota archaeon]|nr:3-phosphoshikimate 1-carboxyvinyltransferase [Aigarchaeota archaeon]MDW8021160.1 3-phosphoshikimate 1-carboxyvinyltransferase [Nitrososphaerota archaeon]
MKIVVRPSVVDGRIAASPSKSYTHRAFAAALLSEGASKIINPLRAQDTEATRRACLLLGADVRDFGEFVEVVGGCLKTPEDVIDVGNSGTTLRLFTAISALAPRGYAILTGDESIRRRPMKPLLEALRGLGVECWSGRLNDTAPIIVKCGGVRGGEAEIQGNISSQFISAILYASVKSERGVKLRVMGEPVSGPYIDATIAVLSSFGYVVKSASHKFFEVEGGQEGRSCSFKIPGDFGSAAFLMAGAHLTGGELEVRGLSMELPQADAKIIDVLRSFGSRVELGADAVTVRGAGGGGGGEYDLRESPDLLPVIAVMAAKSGEETVIRGVGHARYKESDRIRSMALELSKLGVEVEELPDGLRVRGREKLRGGCVFDSHGDHRVFMAFTVLAAATELGCTVMGAEWAEISYPGFLQDARSVGLGLEES